MAKKKNDDIFYGFNLNKEQEVFKEAIMSDDNNVVIADATAGSGKTLLAVACAHILCKTGKYDSAVYIFPTVEEASLGYRPGNTTEKEADYLGPLYDALVKIRELPQQAISSDISEKNGTAWITARSATFMRGINLENKVVIIDECQNMSVPIIKRIISRCYDNCKVIVLGCQAQTDVPLNKSGFKQLIDHMSVFEGCVKCELPISYRGKLAMHIDKL
jgi:predicted ribonuclease YlaK